jgi:hypothetical protein
VGEGLGFLPPAKKFLPLTKGNKLFCFYAVTLSKENDSFCKICLQNKKNIFKKNLVETMICLYICPLFLQTPFSVPQPLQKRKKQVCTLYRRIKYSLQEFQMVPVLFGGNKKTFNR